MRLLYSLGICVFGLALRIAAIFNQKAKLWTSGRKDLFSKVEKSLENLDRSQHPVIWFHVSSLGEFEQGRPLIEAIREDHPECKILLTFFSPSGYEVRKNYSAVDFVFYLPLDTLSNARKWVKLVNPRLAVFVKYDFWYNTLSALHQKEIPVYFISVLFRPGQFFFKGYGHWFRRQLGAVTWFFVQNEPSGLLLGSIGMQNVTITGDTRFDRVYSIARNKKSFPLVENFCAGKKIFIGGSTWKEDEDILLPLINHAGVNLKYILAPHDVSRDRVNEITSRLQRPFILYSEMKGDNLAGKEILVIDTVGILSQLYQYATIAFIGGGFGAGIHNIQEPITFGVPVFFGPKYQKFTEATDLVGLGGALCIQSSAELKNTVSNILADPEIHYQMSSVCRNYVEQHRGATEIILNFFKTSHALRD
jgi:3-deoxy-D-manno-octulosonic-acid transferase